jgi:Kdo2-lipid IVA lauroyltransferase/acyltransferase
LAKKRSNLQTKLEYYAVRGIVGGIGLLPLKTSMNLGAAFGRLVQKAAGKLNRTGKRNLQIALPDLNEAEQEKILRGCFESLGRQLGLVAHFKDFTPEKVRNLLEIEGREYYDHAAETGRGILFFTGHFGSWEIFNLVPYAFAERQMNILVRRIDNAKVENYVESLRTRFGARTIDKKTSARTMFRLLQNGELLGIVADLNAQEHEGVFVDFFGLPASTTTGLAKLALRTDAIVLPAFAIWQPEKQKYLLKLEPPVDYEKTGDGDADVRELTQKVTKVIENFVRRHPEQWMWVHKRWNTRPKGEPSLYG